MSAHAPMGTQIRQDGSALIILSEARKCVECGAMHFWYVNRDGRTRCEACDFKYVRGGRLAA